MKSPAKSIWRSTARATNIYTADAWQPCPPSPEGGGLAPAVLGPVCSRSIETKQSAAEGKAARERRSQYAGGGLSSCATIAAGGPANELEQAR
jgi:hypothetical protein